MLFVFFILFILCVFELLIDLCLHPYLVALKVFDITLIFLFCSLCDVDEFVMQIADLLVDGRIKERRETNERKRKIEEEGQRKKECDEVLNKSRRG